MKKLLNGLIFLILSSKLFSQSFTINFTIDTLVLSTSQNGNIHLTATPSGGFSSSIFLSVVTFPTGLISISPNVLNAPYTNCSVNINAANLGAGIHMLIVKGAQGSIVSYDTAYVKVVVDQNQKWYQFKKENSGVLFNEVTKIVRDKNDNIYVVSAVYSNAYNGISFYNHENWIQYTTNTQYNMDFQGHITSTVTPGLISGFNGTINDFAIDSNNVAWMATTNGLYRYDSSGVSPFFLGEDIRGVTTFNNKVLIISSGVRFFDGTNWVNYNSSNSYLPSNSITQICLESDTSMWIGTQNGLAYFDKHFWTIYNTSNSNMSDHRVTAMDIDHNGNLWFAAFGTGLMKLKNGLITNYNNVPCSEIAAVHCDHSNNIWLGFWSGEINNALVKFDGTNWTVFNSSNSGFKSDSGTPGYGRIRHITEDSNHTIWMATMGDGVFAYNESGLETVIPSYLIENSPIGIIENKISSIEIKNYPNPSNGTITIETVNLYLKEYNITIYDIHGACVYSNILSIDTSHAKKIETGIKQNGVYFLTLKSDDNSFNNKIVILGE